MQGATRRELTTALDNGEVKRIVRGWYAFRHADQRVVTGIRAGGRVGCLTGCRLHQLWTPKHDVTHVVFGRGSELTPVPGTVLHADEGPQPSSAVWPLLDCLRHVAHRHGMEDALIVAESALHNGLVSPDELRGLSLPGRSSRFLRYLNRAESGSETRVRLFLEQHGVRLLPQVEIPGVGRVDLLVGDNLIIECDSEAHHGSDRDYREDRRRDLAARDLGFDTIRLSYAQIWYQWESTKRSLLRQIRLRRHISRT
ncbi:MAG: hypothetical protein IPJ61_15465 [Tessaracoccus sp.]|uniref:hypothetical protein n=1 Tax=Tessaracoccus sp. TaxID=1971211 RepID=UPI001EBA2EE7|nr:hypothetical protein [Tessaracoccus sp.]MBK7822415.1 hypothetical protein [Tessaracoccus sp.]